MRFRDDLATKRSNPPVRSLSDIKVLDAGFRIADYPQMRSSRKKAAKRVQYAALPYRRRGNSRTEVMLVTSRETGRWIIPKGWPQRRKKPHTSAANEAREEAGVVGKIERDPIGSYSYKKKLKSGALVPCEVRVFPLKVNRQKRGWPEKEEREARWFSRTEASKAVREPALSNIIRSFRKGR
jgi:8-oxo-dGTP pyrophosphatase MutT (NUDIX family)